MDDLEIPKADSLADITAVVLAGGLGTRLRPIVGDRPKALAQVAGRPFLAYILDQLATAGVKDVVLCTAWLGEQVEAAFGGCYGPLHLTYSREPLPMGTAGALQLALPLLKSDWVLVMNGDSFCQANLWDFWQWHRRKGAEATLLLTEMEDTKRYGRVWVDDRGVVFSFEEKGKQRGAGLINAGIYLLKKEMLFTTPAQEVKSLEKEIFPSWIGRGLYGYPSRAPFLDIGTPEAYARAERFFKWVLKG